MVEGPRRGYVVHPHPIPTVPIPSKEITSSDLGGQRVITKVNGQKTHETPGSCDLRLVPLTLGKKVGDVTRS